jgi:uncharacterized protein (TIGR02145 family)
MSTGAPAGGLAKSGASSAGFTDTIICSLNGFTTAKKPVATSSGINDIILQPQLPTVTDIDGNVYHAITIGTQVWMVENLKTTKYNDGTALPMVTGGTDWWATNTPAYCWYNNDQTNKNTYGALYNWWAMNTGRLAPTGWHVPSETDWNTLFTYLGGASVAGGPLKEIGIAHWISPNIGARNSYGFSALPGGHRDDYGGFHSIDTSGTWWSSTGGPPNAYGSNISNAGSNVDYHICDSGVYAFSIRCIRN